MAIEDNYTTDYSTYYLDFAASLPAQEWDAAPAASSGYTRNDAISALRDAAKTLADRRGITITEARDLLRTNANLRIRLMGADLAAAWEGRQSLSSGSTSTRTASQTASGQTPDYYSTLNGLGLADGLFDDLVDRAIRNGWSDTRLRSEILASKQFEQLFPGIKRPDGSLRMSTQQYRQLADSYIASAKEFGVNMSPQRVGYLVEGDVSPQEFYQRLGVFEKVKSNPGLMDSFNEQVKQFGLKPMDQQDWFKFLAGVGSKDYYDVYEAAQLRSSGLKIDAQTAASAARNIGDNGAPADIQSLVSQARTMLSDIGPELLRAGISDADLVQMGAGYDPKGLENSLRTIVANRRASGQTVMGSRVSGSGSASSVFTPDAPAAY